MITFHIITIFPEIIECYVKCGVLGKAVKNKIIAIKIYNLRDFTTDKNKTVADVAYGGRAGMIMKCEPIYRAINEIKNNTAGKTITILLDPKGKLFSQSYAENLKKYGGFIPGIRPGQKTSDYIYRVLTRITFAGSIYLAIVCVIPEFLIYKLNMPFYFGGTSLLIVIGVALDTAQQIETHMITRNYEGFMRKGRIKGRSM